MTPLNPEVSITYLKVTRHFERVFFFLWFRYLNVSILRFVFNTSSKYVHDSFYDLKHVSNTTCLENNCLIGTTEVV